MRASTLARLTTVGGRTDALRIGMTAAGSALATVTLLAAATVAAVPDPTDPGNGFDPVNEQYGNPLIAEPGLRPGVVVALLVVAVPVLALAGQCVRFGSPARDRRLAALRLAGATPGQAVVVATAETAAAALLGSLVGYGAFLLGRLLLDRPGPSGKLPLPTDVLPSAAITAGILLAVPLLAGLLAAFLLRRVIVTPLGVVRRTRARAPRPWPGVLLVIGGFGPFVSPHLARPIGALPEVVSLTLLYAFLLLPVVGVVVGAGSISYICGRILVRVGRRPAMLLAGRQLMAAPWTGSRNLAALLAGLVVGAGALCVRTLLTTQVDATIAARRLVAGVIWYSDNDHAFVLRTLELVTWALALAVLTSVAGVMVALAEGIVARRRGYAALVATGVPRRTLGEAIAWQAMTPLIPAGLVALIVGSQLARTAGGMDTRVQGGGDEIGCYTAMEQCTAATAQDSTVWTNIAVPQVSLAVPVPVEALALLGVSTVVAMLAAAGVGLLFLRSSTDLALLRVV